MQHDQEKRVKIRYENKHATSRTFALHTDQPSLVHLPQHRLALSAGASAFVELVFQARPLGACIAFVGVR